MLACALALGLGASGCGSTMEFTARGTQRVPAAKADIEIDDDDEGREVDLEIHDLAAPQSLGDGYERYGVWLVPPGGAPYFAGFLRYQSDIEYGDLETISPFRDFEILVTAERAQPGLAPSDAIVLRQSVP